MESKDEHREVPTENALVKPVKVRKKRHRERHLAAGRRGEIKELTRVDCGFRRMLAAACRMVLHLAAVAWRKRDFLRKNRNQGNCGPRKELTAVAEK
jgi:hypothetical protein